MQCSQNVNIHYNNKIKKKKSFLILQITYISKREQCLNKKVVEEYNFLRKELQIAGKILEFNLNNVYFYVYTLKIVFF